MLGVEFDCKLVMAMAVKETADKASWKVRAVLRTRSFFSTVDLIRMYKSQVLSQIEFKTPAIYHASDSVLARLDSVQTTFLREIGIDEITALVEFILGPLGMRRSLIWVRWG